MDLYKKIAIAIVDVVVLIQLTVSIYIANSDLDNFTPLFFKCFFSMLVPTLILACVLMRKFFPGQTRPAS